LRRSGGWGIVWKKCIKRVGGSLTLRIFLITFSILAAACALTYGFVAWATPISYSTIVNSDLAEKATALTQALEKTTLAECGPLVDRFILDTGVSILVSDAEGNPVELPNSIAIATASDCLEEEDNVVVFRTNGKRACGESKTDAGSPSEDTFQVSDELVTVTSDAAQYSFSFQGSDMPYTMTVLSSVTATNQTVEALGQVLPFLLIVVLVISLLGAIIYSRYITRPIVQLSGISQRMANLDFSYKCQEKRGDEIGVLGRNLNELSERLSTSLNDLREANCALRQDIDRERELEKQRTTFFSAASHELKTPITVLKGQLSGMLAGVDIYKDREKYLARSLAVASRMEALVQEILMVSRMERADVPLKRESLDLTRLVEQQVQQMEELAMLRGQALYVEAVSNLIVEGDRVLLQRAVGNLLSNALLYSPEGETVQVCLFEQEEKIILTISNSGVQIPIEDLPHLFEAFYRVEASRSRGTGGSGLGLYIVKMVLDRHRAAYRMENVPDGVRATVVFPKA
ncbi:MAG: ATP-binding protein, partial [Anaeromassilibacillus sp.]